MGEQINVSKLTPAELEAYQRAMHGKRIPIEMELSGQRAVNLGYVVLKIEAEANHLPK